MGSTVNERIREARINKHYTQERAGELINMKCSTYSQMERQGTISVDLALELARVLEADPFYIIFGETKEKLALDFAPVASEVLKVNEPQTFIDKIKSGQDELVLTHREKNIIKNLRDIKNPQDYSEVIKFLESKLK